MYLKYGSPTTYSLCIVGAFQLLGAVIFALPFIIKSVTMNYLQIPLTQNEVMGFWGLCSFLTCVVFVSLIIPRVDRYFSRFFFSMCIVCWDFSVSMDVYSYKIFATVPTLLFLSTGSLLNFSFALACAAVVVPFYALLSATSNRFWKFLQLALLLVVSPASLALGVFLFFGDVNQLLSIMATIVDQYLLFSNMFYPFLCLVYIPLNLSFLKLVISNK